MAKMFKKTFPTVISILRGNPVALSLRLRHKINKLQDKKDSPKLAADVINYLNNSPEYKGLMEQLPRSLLKKYKTPESMYLINKKTAKEIAKTIKSHLKNSPVVEVNPGLGLLSEELLQVHKGPHFFYESSSHFLPHLAVSSLSLFPSYVRHISNHLFPLIVGYLCFEFQKFYNIKMTISVLVMDNSYK